MTRIEIWQKRSEKIEKCAFSYLLQKKLILEIDACFNKLCHVFSFAIF